jgi:transposase
MVEVRMDSLAWEQLRLENQRLREQVAQLQQTIRELEKRLEASERSAKRQAAPFSKGKPKDPPKKPGRKSGDEHGEHGHRDAPTPEQIDETLDAALPAECPHCYLNKHAGMSHGKIADTFDKAFGISLTRGASAQIVLRAGKKLQPVYEQIKEKIIDSEHLTPDETGWRIGGHPAWLHGWVGEDGATLYTIDPQRSADVLEKVIGIDWSGSMTHDGFSSYERFENVAHQQCLDHALRRARSLVDKHTGMAKVFPQQVIDLLMESLQQRDELDAAHADPDRRGQAFESFAERLGALTKRPRVNLENARFAKHLRKHVSGWFLFLVDPTIPATNHRAEQALKTPIVNRKVWGGNRTGKGGEAQAVVGSVLQTCKNKAVDAFTYFSNAFRGILGDLFA